jgi:hypothetical protein
LVWHQKNNIQDGERQEKSHTRHCPSSSCGSSDYHHFDRHHPQAASLFLLPTTEKPPAGFTQKHLSTLRGWEKPATTTPENNAWSTFKTDPGHISFLAEPVASHQPQRPAKGTWQQFKEKQQQRAMQTQASKPLEKWHFQPKGSAYWREVGREMQARKTWWEKMKDLVGL